MDTSDKNTGKTQANDDVSHNAHYEETDRPSHLDTRDKKDSTKDWNAEKSRTSRHK